ncbi:Type I restriction-modification system, specificity subunit S [Campylobacter concisus UNSW1]|uniref:restriction endonuclease subunit S n=1 Tax=Campylobacter concisus TaxID=199 RepID=UPI00039896DF|nr:restriction endonuclease subunit S [Campylobacter concisus]ERJ22156.1 Type I restriction-modification system, specificity subunit S [Campylobacter concisus UNSW1]
MSEFKNLPSGWRVVKLGDVCDFYKGKGISKDDISENGISCIRYGELYTTYSEKIDKIYSKTNLNTDELFLSKCNDIIIPCSGETAQDIAKASCVLLDNIALGGDLNVLRTRQNGIFLSYYLNVITKKDIAKIAQGVSIVHLYASELKNLKIKIPPLDEQEKIVEILSTWDEAINLTINLIENKKQFKKALMQNLLTAKIRFPQFKDEWKEIKLGEICEIQTGKLNANAMIQGGRYKFFTCAKEVFEIDCYAFDTEAILISGNGENVGYIHYFNGKFNAYQRTYVLDKFTENILFIKYFLEFSLKRKIEIEKKDGNTPYIVLSTIFDFIVRLPNLNEQQKIAEVLIAYDDEINLLNLKLENLKKQKQGLMQKLLSGKVRVK